MFHSSQEETQKTHHVLIMSTLQEAAGGGRIGFDIDPESVALESALSLSRVLESPSARRILESQFPAAEPCKISSHQSLRKGRNDIIASIMRIANEQ